jgi:hypothetical protein
MHGVRDNFSFSSSPSFPSYPKQSSPRRSRRKPRMTLLSCCRLDSRLPCTSNKRRCPYQFPSIGVPPEAATEHNNATFIHLRRRSLQFQESTRHAHPYSIKWLQRSVLSTPHLLPPLVVNLLSFFTETTNTVEPPPPPLLTAEPSTSPSSTATRCGLVPPNPPLLPHAVLARYGAGAVRPQ